MGKDMVVLSSNEAITDLLEKRSSIYSDRVGDMIICVFRSNTMLQPQSTMMEL